MATITHLPDDVIIIILEKKRISLEDIVNLKSTCKRFQQIILPNKFWERKYYYRCPTANKKYNVDKKNKIFDYLNFKEPIKAGMKCMEKLQNYMLLMSEDKLWDADKKELECLLRSIVQDSMLYYFFWDEQKRIIDAELPWLNDLTYRYNFDLIFNCLKQYRFIYKISKFMNKPKKKQLLEELFTIIAQYFLPRLSCSVIKTWLDDIAQEVLSRLKNKYPEHSIFTTFSKQLSFWRDNNIDGHFWNQTETKQITEIFMTFVSLDFLFVIVDKLCQLLNIKDNIRDKYMNNISGHFRNYLKVITCYCVARRLGICSVLRPSDDYITITFQVPNDRRGLNAECLGTNERRDENSNSENRSYNNIQIIRMMMAHFIQLTGNKKFYKWNLSILSKILSNYQNQNIEQQNMDIEAQYKSITETIKIPVEKPDNTRNKNIKISIGVIVKHLSQPHLAPPKKSIYHEGVVIGWHSKCDPNFQTKFMKTHMFPYLYNDYQSHRICMCAPCTCFKSNLVSDDQPHYIILTENNKICYIREDYIEICLPKKINNMEIGRFFSRFHGLYYEPNKSLANRYGTGVYDKPNKSLTNRYETGFYDKPNKSLANHYKTGLNYEPNKNLTKRYETVPLHCATDFSLNNSAHIFTNCKLNFILSVILSFISITLIFILKLDN